MLWKRESFAAGRKWALYWQESSPRLISTMETSTVSARNAVGLYLEKLFGFDFVHGGEHCPWQQSEDNLSTGDWAGWGCQSGWHSLLLHLYYTSAACMIIFILHSPLPVYSVSWDGLAIHWLQRNKNDPSRKWIETPFPGLPRWWIESDRVY